MRPEVSPDFQDYKYYSYYYSYGEEGKDKKGRDRKKGLAFLGRKGKKESKDQNTSTEEEGRGAQKQEAKKVSGRRLLLLFVATAILAVGVLWHNGLIDPFKGFEKQGPGKKEETKPDVKKGVPSKTAIDREPKSPSVEPKRPVSVDEPEVKHETPIPQAQAKPKPSIGVQPPAVEKEISKEISKAKAQGLAKKPIDKPSEAKPGPDIGAPLPESQPVPNTPMGTESPFLARGISEQGIQGKSDIISKEPKIVASREDLGPPAEPRPVPEIRSPVLFNKNVSYPYSLLLYHFRKLERAKEAVSLYTKKGFSAYWVKVELSNGLWYRVFVGYFEGREQAEEFRKEHGLGEAMVKRTAYATLTNTYKSRDDLGARIQFLKDLGYSPYVIEYDDQSRVFAGAFVTKEGAEKQQQELESKGVQNQVIER
jgi:cell division septation protein DedD